MQAEGYRLHPRWASLDELVAAFRERGGGLRLDLGSGPFAPEGFVGIDNLTGSRAQEAGFQLANTRDPVSGSRAQEAGFQLANTRDPVSGSRAQESAADDERAPDLLLDVDRAPLPFDPGSVDEVRASHVLEHIEHDRLGHVFDEVARVLRPGAPWRIAGPYALSDEGLFPSHCVFLTERWFELNPVFQQHFEIVEERFDATDEWKRLPALLRRVLPFHLARRHLFNVCHQFSLLAVRRG